jgi:hypothetical protein
VGPGAVTEEYVYSPGLGRRVKVMTVESPPHKKKRDKPFVVQWVKKPLSWIEALQRSRSIHVRDLADIILVQAFEATGGKGYSDGEIVLSSAAAPNMTRKYRIKAAKELAKLGLITVKSNGHGRRALRVTLTEKSLIALRSVAPRQRKPELAFPPGNESHNLAFPPGNAFEP